MEDKLSLEAFLLKTQTCDGCVVIVGGFCTEGKKDEAVSIYSEISKMKLGQFKDEFLIDYVLAKTVTQLSPRYVCLVGASLHIEGVNNSTGGVLGNPFQKPNSAKGDIEEIIPGIFLVSISGGPGFAFEGTFSEALMLKNFISESKIKGNFKLDDIARELDDITGLYIVVSDGCGPMNTGCIYVSDYTAEKEVFHSECYGFKVYN